MTEKTKKIGIHDDSPDNMTDWVEQLKDLLRPMPDFQVCPISKEEFEDGFKGLEERRKQARSGKKSSGDISFDDYDLLVVDYDLIDDAPGAWITGEEVAYLARCYSRCGPIIGLNRYGHGADTFDLSLKGHMESWADLNISQAQLFNPGLWILERPDGFRPWFWPLLPKLIDDFRTKEEEVLVSTDAGILETLGFNNVRAQLLATETMAFLSVSKKKIALESVTFKDFVEYSGEGLKGKDKVVGDDCLARIAASRIGKWLDRRVLAGQDVLVDLPHLVSRYPSLMGNLRENPNGCARIAEPDAIGIEHPVLARHRFEKKHWLSRPAWWWREISDDESLAEVQDPWEYPPLESVFCEDASCFLPREATREFKSSLPTQFNTRWCVDPSSGTAPAWAKKLGAIQYQPSNRFAL